ncbi:MAG TPA: integrase [Ignavibacteriales bacterium]|nr:integrase [Ignavibacteriales bacterium]
MKKRKGTKKDNVIIREKKLSNGNISLYLDIYRSGKRTYEFLKLYIKDKPLNHLEREENKETYQLAESIRTKRESELNHSEFGFIAPHRQNIDFITFYQEYLDNYTKKDIRMLKGSLEYFKKFLDSKGYSLTQKFLPRQLTKELIISYKEYLEKTLKGETPASYFKRFKKVLKYAEEKEIIQKNPARDIYSTINEGLKKDILTFSEIQLLADAKCGNSEVKRAFLFCLNTGLRFVDVKELRYKNIDFGNHRLKFIQEKTKNSSKNSTVIIDLNTTAQKLIGEIKGADEKIFSLPTHAGCVKSLQNWVTSAGINKHITWHCARHSFAVNLLGEVKTDIKTVASLLGHSGLKHTEKYTRAVDELKNKAVNGMPEIMLGK